MATTLYQWREEGVNGQVNEWMNEWNIWWLFLQIPDLKKERYLRRDQAKLNLDSKWILTAPKYRGAFVLDQWLLIGGWFGDTLLTGDVWNFWRCYYYFLKIFIWLLRVLVACGTQDLQSLLVACGIYWYFLRLGIQSGPHALGACSPSSSHCSPQGCYEGHHGGGFGSGDVSHGCF